MALIETDTSVYLELRRAIMVLMSMYFICLTLSSPCVY